MKRVGLIAAALVGGVAALAGAVGATASERQIQPIPAFSGSQLAATPTQDWAAPHGDIFNQQYSGLAQINKTNVKRLRIAWHTRVVLPTGAKQTFKGVSAEGEPVVYKGTMYLPDVRGNVFAFDAQTGERLWYYKPKFPKGFAAALQANRGVALGDGKVFVAQNDGSIVALDASTGRVRWKTQVDDWKLGYFFTSAPAYADGRLFVGESGGDFGADSKVLALNAKTGRVLWRFHVIPRKPQFGWQTWPAKRAYLGGGAVWATPVVDSKLGLVYFGVGNPVPYNGADRGPGDELFTESILALHMGNGAYAWHFQEVHHDNWDYDAAANPLVAFDLKIKGRLRHAIAGVGKTGWVYILDRRTGKPILGVRERKVPQDPRQHTAPTQPIPVGQPFAAQCPNRKLWASWKAPDGNPVKIGCIFTPYNNQQYTVFAPTALGGADWPPSSYSPRTGELYICSKDSAGAWKALPEVKPGQLKPLGNFFQIEGLFAGPNDPSKKSPGTVVAMNMRSNRVSWKVSFPGGDICYSGVLSTRGGLVFVGRNEGRLQAYDDLTGKLLWSSPKLLSSVNAPAMTYTVDGKQYVAVYAGGNSVSSGFGRVKPRYGSDLYAFALPS